MLRTILRGKDLEKWKLNNGLIVDSAAECFGLTKSKWEKIVSNNEIITSKRTINLFLFYESFPETVPVNAPPNFEDFYLSMGLPDNVSGWKSFGKLIGLSQTTVIRMLHENVMSREVEAYVNALLRLKKKGYEPLEVIKYISEESDRLIEFGLFKGWRIEEWKTKNELIMLSAANMLGSQKSKLEKLIANDEPITQKKLIQLFLIYEKYPETMPVRPKPDFASFYKSIGFSLDVEPTANWKAFGKLLGASVTTVLRMLKNEGVSRDIECYIQGLISLNLDGHTTRSIVEAISKDSDKLVLEGAKTKEFSS